MDTSCVDLLALVERDTDLKWVAQTQGGEFAGPCPWCRGTDRFRVQPNRPAGGRWFCRQCSPQWQDAIAYVMRRDSIGFKEACNQLGLDVPSKRSAHPRFGYRPRVEKTPMLIVKSNRAVALSDPDWQTAARQFSDLAFETLLDTEQGQPGRAYLYRRGLTGDTIRTYRLGFTSRDYRGIWGHTEVYVPRHSIVFPWMESSASSISGSPDPSRILKVKYRSIYGKEFSQARGGADGLYGLSLFNPGTSVTLVESEICACSLWQTARNLVIPLATGSVDAGRISSSIMRLSQAAHVLLAFDADGPGKEAAKWWQGVLPHAIRLCPTRHDVNDMLTAGDDIIEWLQPYIASWQKMQPSGM